MKYRIFVPSRSRTRMILDSIVPALSEIREVFAVVPPEEVEAYEDALQATSVSVLGCPKRGLPATRNWILDTQFEQDDDMLVMIDDDVKKVAWALEKYLINLYPAGVIEMLEEGYHMARHIGSNIWSIRDYPGGDMSWFDRFKPIRFHGRAAFTVSAFLTDQYRIDENIKIRDDYEFSMRMLFYSGIVFVDERYTSVQIGNVRGSQMGGVTDVRTKKNVGFDQDYILHKFGPLADRWNARKSIYAKA